MKSKTMPSFSDKPRHVLIVGVGHASIYLFRSIGGWVDAGHEVTVLNDHPFFYYSGMLPEYLGGVYRRDHIRVDLEASCRRVGATLLLGKAETLDLSDRVVGVAGGSGVACDLAVFDIGSVNPHADSAGRAVLTKPLHRLELLDRELQDGHLQHLAIVGGGAAGIEIALNLSARYPDLDISILEASPRILPEFPGRAARLVQRLLSDRRVRIQRDVRVASVVGTEIRCESATFEADFVLWATGTTGQGIFEAAGLPCDERGFVRVDGTLRCASAPWLFAAGDCAAVYRHEDLRRIGVHAVKQGSVLEANVGAMLARKESDLHHFRPYPIAPLILSTGTRRGILSTGSFVLSNNSALRLKHWLDLRWMRTFNRNLEVEGLDLIHSRHAGSSD